jgi:hypothetical protein
VYTTSPEQMFFCNYHCWAVDPREFVINVVAERVHAGGNFAQVRLYDGRSDIDYVLSGRLEKREEIDFEGGSRLRLRSLPR